MGVCAGKRREMGRTSGGTFRVRRYTGDPFMPRPYLREGPKSRRQYPVRGFCIRAGRCRNDGKRGKCGDACISYSGWKERES